MIFFFLFLKIINKFGKVALLARPPLVIALPSCLENYTLNANTHKCEFFCPGSSYPNPSQAETCSTCLQEMRGGVSM